MNSLSIAFGMRNTHGYKRNLLYFLYSRYCRLKSGVVCSARDLEIARELHRTGIAEFGVSDVAEMARIAEEKLAAVPVVDGYAQFPRKYNPLLVPYMFRVLQEHKGALQACFRSHFRVNWFEVQKIAPGQQAPGSSFGYHTDDTPLPLIKLFIYLTDTGESNGAFRAFGYRETDELIRRGMLDSVSPGEKREQAQRLVTPDYEKRLRVVEGRRGTVFVFDNNLIHKGTLPRQGTRIHVSMEIMPSPVPQTLDALSRDCDKDVQEYFPINPFRRSAVH
jgi:hypothetical protein